MTKRPIGRPTSYRPEIGQKVSDAMAAGLSAEAAAAKVGISARSLFNWQQEHPGFLQSIQEGRQRALLWWEERALAMAEGEPGSASIVSLGLRNRSRAATGWHDAQRLEHSGVDGGPIQQQVTHRLDVSTLSDEQLEALEMALLATMGLVGVDGGRDGPV